MFNRYFQQEIAYLKELGVEFSRSHPALSPMLSGPTSDPDVERLLEGVAFLTALLRQKLDDEFPEITHDLMQLICPHYLRPIPSTTTLAFSPRSSLNQSLKIPAGIYYSSIPVGTTSCLFQTCYDVEIHPLDLLDAEFSQPSGELPVIKLLFELNGINVSEWQPENLRFYLAGDYAGATDLYLLLCNHLKRIIITPHEKGSRSVLPGEFLKPAGFGEGEALIPYPSHAFPGYRILQEYFISPQKFLYLDLAGWDRWRDRGEGSKFEISFELEQLPIPAPRIKGGSFVLFATPAINVFPHDADPILLDHRKTEYMIRPSGSEREHHQIYSVENVVGFIQGTAEERTYVPFELFSPDPNLQPVYHVTRRGSPIRPGVDLYLSVAYPADVGLLPVSETLSIFLLCTNGSLPEKLQLGDISTPTSSSPEGVECRNIQSPTPNVLPPLGSNIKWRLLSHLSLNYLSLAKAENLRALLELYIFPESRDRPTTVAHRRRINGIEGVDAASTDRLVSGILMRGQEIKMRLRQDHFASPGDLFLFGCILDAFFGSYASINSFTSLSIHEVLKGNVYRWPARLGNHHLL